MLGQVWAQSEADRLYWTNPWPFHINFSSFSKMYWNLIWKSPGIVLFEVNLTPFLSKSGLPGWESNPVEAACIILHNPWVWDKSHQYTKQSDHWWNTQYPGCNHDTYSSGFCQGWQICHLNCVRLSPNGTNLGLFKISFSTFWLGEPKMYWNWS